MIVEIDKEDVELIIKFFEESNKLLRDNGYSPNAANIRLLNRLKLKLESAELNQGRPLCEEIKRGDMVYEN